MYSCSNSECALKKWSSNQLKSDETLPFVPLRLMVCAHSICEICCLHECQQNKTFIKCSICGFNTTITESVSRNVVQYESDIKKWLDSSGSVGQVIQMQMNSFPLDLHSIASAVDSGLLTATKTPVSIDLDLDDDTLVTDSSALNSNNSCLTEDDMTVAGIISKVPKTASKNFHEVISKSVKTFTDLSTNHASIKRTSDETKELFKKLRTVSKETFHRLHSILQLREKELLDEIDSIEETRLQELRVFMNEILSKRAELKGKLLHCSQLQSDKDKNMLKKAIEQLVKDSNILHLNSPQNDYKLIFNSTIENQLKEYGTIERNSGSGHEEVSSKEEAQDITDLDRDLPISVSSDEEDVDSMSTEGSEQTMSPVIVTVLQAKSPQSFYVQKVIDKEKFEILKSEIKQICSSAYYHAPAIGTLDIGERIFAYSSIFDCWCRATLIHHRQVENEEISFLADVFLIDYGTVETVHWYNVREKKSELFDDKEWPTYAYRCALYNVKPARRGSSRDWSSESLDLFQRYVNNNQLAMFVFETKDDIIFVDLMHYDVPEVTSYPRPSIIEILVHNEYAFLSGDIDFPSFTRYKPLKYAEPELPKRLKTVSVLVSHVESPDLFYVQLQRQHNILLKLIDELNQIYNESNAGIYTYYCPKVNTPCAALFDGDNRFYRAIVSQKGKSANETVVQFVDFGNKQVVKNSNLRLLKDSMIQKLSIQSIACYLIHVEPSYGFKWSQNATDYFKFSISNDRGPQILTMCVYEVDKQQKLGVVLRSYDGDQGVKINETLVKHKHAVSRGPLSLPDDESEIMTSSQESLNSISSFNSPRSKTQTTITLPFKVSAFIVVKEMFERSKLAKADKRSSLIKVSICSVRDPSKFYVQIDKPEIKSYFQQMEKLLHEEYSSSKHRHLDDTNFVEEDLCAFKVDGDWKRGQVIQRLNNTARNEAPEEQKFKVLDIDYGVEYELIVSQMRRLSDQFTKDGSFAVMCHLAYLQPTGGSDWAHSAKDEFKHVIKKFENSLYILVKETEIIKEPISVRLYAKETIIPGAFEKQKIVYHSMSQILTAKGLAIWDKNELSISVSDWEADDNEINEETPRELRTQLPFSLCNGSDSVLEGLQQRHQQTSDSNPHLGKFFKYLDEVYPVEEREFYGIPTDIDMSNDFNISFRYWKEKVALQPLQLIEKNIEDTINSKGELEPFVGPYTKDNACTAYFEYDKSWNRAEIVGISRKSNEDHSQLIVRFVDYGNKESILVDKLSSELFGIDVPKLALKCQICDINPVDNEAIAAIRNIIYYSVIDKKCKFFWQNYPELPMKVSLQIPHQNDYVTLRSLLLDQNLITEEIIDIDKSPVQEVISYQSLLEESFGSYPVKFDKSKFYQVVMSFPLVNNYAFFQANQTRQPINEENAINDEHDNFIWMLEEMRNNIETYRLLRNFRRGMPCLAQFSDDFWYRGLVINVDFDSKTAEIFFIDYGNTDNVAFNRIREIPVSHMRKVKAHAFLCEIYNIRPRSNNKWSTHQDLIERMIEHLSIISNEGKLFAKFKTCDSIPYKIDLYVETDEKSKPGKHAFQEFVDNGLLEFIDPREVWRKPIQMNQSYRSQYIKTERMD